MVLSWIYRIIKHFPILINLIDKIKRENQDGFNNSYPPPPLPPTSVAQPPCPPAPFPSKTLIRWSLFISFYSWFRIFFEYSPCFFLSRKYYRITLNNKKFFIKIYSNYAILYFRYNNDFLMNIKEITFFHKPCHNLPTLNFVP